jgi:C_GCAxxG_C_C family probable redox protein
MKRKKAVSDFNQGYNCAQSVFSAFSDEFGINKELARSIACGFGAGFGRLQETCGAVTGAIMVIGCKYFKRNDWSGSKEIVYQKTRDFISRFKERNGTINCLELIGVDFNTEEGMQTAKKKNLFRDKCEKYVRDACEILEEII